MGTKQSLQDLAAAHTAKGTRSRCSDHGVTVLDWSANALSAESVEH